MWRLSGRGPWVWFAFVYKVHQIYSTAQVAVRWQWTINLSLLVKFDDKNYQTGAHTTYFQESNSDINWKRSVTNVYCVVHCVIITCSWRPNHESKTSWITGALAVCVRYVYHGDLSFTHTKKKGKLPLLSRFPGQHAFSKIWMVLSKWITEKNTTNNFILLFLEMISS